MLYDGVIRATWSTTVDRQAGRVVLTLDHLGRLTARATQTLTAHGAACCASSNPRQQSST